MSISPEHLQVILEATVRLVELRQKECKHLCIENIAPEMFAGLLGAYVKGAPAKTPTSVVNIVGVEGKLDVKGLIGL